MAHVLVTGAGGFIGSHLTERLVRDGHGVRALIRYNALGRRGWLDALPADIAAAVEIVAGDIRDPHQASAYMAGREIVFHLAALVAIPYSCAAPRSYVDTNINGSLNLLQAARNAGVERFIQTSTSEVYGTARTVPMAETHPPWPQSPYAATKLGADHLALSFHHAFGLPVAVIRPFNAYGPRQSARAVIPAILSQILAGQSTIRLGATGPTRDFTFVTDTVDGFAAAATAPAAVGRIVNLGTNHEISIGETAALLAEIVGREIRIEADPRRLRPPDSEVWRLWCDNSLASRLLDWRPAHGGRAGLRRGLEKTVAWFRDPAHLQTTRSATGVT